MSIFYEIEFAKLIIRHLYDRMNRLVSETYQGEETSYVYDLCGNRLKKLDKSGTEEYHYNRKNQLISRFSEKDKTAYRYDLQGNLLEAAGAEGRTAFSYNAFHQQTAILMPDGNRLENRYDAEYLRAGTVENGVDRTFLYYNGELLAESDPLGKVVSRYILGYGVAAGWNREKEGYHSYHLDEQNSTAYITGSSGEIENRYEYDAFGTIKDSREEFPNRILYTGQQYDQTSGQYYLRARFYNPVLGRFVQEDVYRGDGLNLYAYCKNNPVVYYDPSGYDSQYPCKEEASTGESSAGESGSSSTTKPIYKPSPKHDPASGWGSPNPIPDIETGQNLLDTAYSSSKNKQLYNIYDNQLIKFQPDTVEGWHSYLVKNSAKEVPTDVLRKMLEDNKITKVQYKDFIKNNKR